MSSLDELRLIAFRSEIGWIGVCFHGPTICRVRMGYATRSDLLQVSPVVAAVTGNARETEIVARFRRFLAGEKTSLLKLRIDQSWMTPFQRRVTDACRRIPWGETLSYGQLAEIAGSPGASRAVGSVMANNRFPLVVPCHRVVSSQGVGGFSAPNGLRLKRQLLENESAGVVTT